MAGPEAEHSGLYERGKLFHLAVVTGTMTLILGCLSNCSISRICNIFQIRKQDVNWLAYLLVCYILFNLFPVFVRWMNVLK